LAQDLGPFGITANRIAPRVIATGRVFQTVIPGSSQSNRDRAEAVALRRLGTVEDCAKVVEFLATDLSNYVTGAAIPIDGVGSRLSRGGRSVAASIAKLSYVRPELDPEVSDLPG
jgi:NAD(P)-dependent dehydrogenase (short-subunit alcohol dehydrogenase family)